MPAEALASWLDNYEPEQVWLKLAAKDLTPAQRALRIWSLIIDHWLQQLHDCADSARLSVNLPVMDSYQCHCGSYFAQLRQQQVLPADQLDQLEQLHQQLHDAGLKLKLALEQIPESIAEELQRCNVVAEKLKLAISEHR